RRGRANRRRAAVVENNRPLQILSVNAERLALTRFTGLTCFRIAWSRRCSVPNHVNPVNLVPYSARLVTIDSKANEHVANPVLGRSSNHCLRGVAIRTTIIWSNATPQQN